MTTELKPWQHGYELEYLKKIEGYYKEYNSFAFGPFAKFKKNDIANCLWECSFNHTSDFSLCYCLRTAKVKTPITMYQDIVIGYKYPQDKVLSHLVGKDSHELLSRIEGNVWFGFWAEDLDMLKLIRNIPGWKYVGAKITTFGEIYSIWFKDSGTSLGIREHPKVCSIEQIGVEKIYDFNLTATASGIDQELLSAVNDITFQNHYSNYNKNKSWSAISLKGYSSDVTGIEKPIEMSKKWKKENPDWENWYLQETSLMNKIPRVPLLLKSPLFRSLGFEDYHRIRFMKLTPGGGELSRHTDQVDPDSGLSKGKLARIHFPITTNRNVEFTVWEPSGNKKTINMEAGSIWVLDTRKPHMVVNKGSNDRIHLVMDVVVNDKLEELFFKHAK